MTLRAAIDQYVAWRQAQGARFQAQAYVLRRYSRSVGDGVGCDEVRSDEARAFVDGGATASNNRAYKHSVLAGFFRYAVARGLATRSPLPVVAPKTFPPALPYIYSREELRRLLDATKTYRKRVNQLEPHTFRTLLLVLYGAGLRRGEALHLTLADVDLQAAVLTVRETKFDKTRFVPLGPQLAQAMEEYATQRRASDASQTGEAPFFVNRDGTPLAARTVSKAFVHLRRAAGVSREPEARYQPRLHDLRHAFAVHRLTAWYREGADVQRLLPLLSTYLGHVSVAATQVYLSMTPELLEEAALRFERYTESGNGGDHG